MQALLSHLGQFLESLPDVAPVRIIRELRTKIAQDPATSMKSMDNCMSIACLKGTSGGGRLCSSLLVVCSKLCLDRRGVCPEIC